MTQISCSCQACKGKAARIPEVKAQGLTPTMIHNYVAYAGTPIGTAMGIVSA
jgi:hypothetical protein